jgi:hypothetical protein
MTWVYVTSDVGAIGTILNASAGTQKNIGLEVQTGTQLLRISDAAFGAIETGGLGIATWHHVALVRTATPQWLSYIDGVLDSTLTAWDTPSPASDVIRVGLNNIATERHDGRVEAMKLWTAQLTAPEILAEMARYDPVVTANNWAWWPLTAHTDVTDHSVNARHWTANGTLTTEAGPGGITEGGGANVTPTVGATSLAGIAALPVQSTVRLTVTP